VLTYLPQNNWDLPFGVQGGAEIGVHATRRFLENMIPGQVFIKILNMDVYSAINCSENQHQMCRIRL